MSLDLAIAEHLDFYDIRAARGHAVDTEITALVSYRIVGSASGCIDCDNWSSFNSTVLVADTAGD